MARNAAKNVRNLLESEDVSEILRENFFAPRAQQDNDALGTVGDTIYLDGSPKAKAKPDHYKVICISLYNDDLRRLDDTVRELKRRGYTKANRSAVLRVAMTQLDLDRVPRGL